MTIDQYQDIIDVRDIIERFEELKSGNDEGGSPLSDEDFQELQDLHKLLEDLKGYGGDEQWEGDWYPITLIRDSYFTTYAQELADDICEPRPSERSWPFTCIDWEKAAGELQIDYDTVEFHGVTYWYR